jgi:hypothetical protein
MKLSSKHDERNSNVSVNDLQAICAILPALIISLKAKELTFSRISIAYFSHLVENTTWKSGSKIAHIASNEVSA